MNIFGTQSIDLIETRKKYGKPIRFLRKHKKVNVKSINVDGIGCEWLSPIKVPQDRVILYLHGGAWFMGSLITYRSMVSRLAYFSKSTALTVDYRLAPEHPFPAGFDDCVTAYRWLLKQGYDSKKIVIAGDSAGGNLTLATLIKLRDDGDPIPGGAVVISPATDLSGEIGKKEDSSYGTRAHQDVFFSKMIRNGDSNPITKAYYTTYDPKNPYISPFHADLEGLPKLLMHVGDQEILLDDTLQFAAKARSVGVNVTDVVWPHMFHVFHMFAPYIPEANRALAEIGDFIQTVQNN